jgi:DNA-binding response OmpR family regulator
LTAILIVEDEAKTAETVRLYLERAGYEAEIAADGRRGLALARSGRFALVVLDLMLPEIDGLTVCQRLRQESEVRILMLTALSTEDDRIGGLDLGADDYVTKPFSPRELVARVRAVLRRTDPSEWSGPRRLSHGELVLDLDSRSATIGGRRVELTATEVRLLRALMRAPGRTFSRAELVDTALGLDFEGSDRTIDVHVRNLRRKIEPESSEPCYVKTVFGVGYRLGGVNGST